MLADSKWIKEVIGKEVANRGRDIHIRKLDRGRWRSVPLLE
jgi:hypothetical protein